MLWARGVDNGDGDSLRGNTLRALVERRQGLSRRDSVFIPDLEIAFRLEPAIACREGSTECTRRAHIRGPM